MKAKHPDDMNGDDFSSKGGLDLYRMVYELKGLVSRHDWAIKILMVMMAAILAKQNGAW